MFLFWLLGERGSVENLLGARRASVVWFNQAVRIRRPGPDKVKLLFCPFWTPHLRRGRGVHCLDRDWLAIVHGWTDAPISWTLCRPAEERGRSGLLVEEGLSRSVRGESALALMHRGASTSVVHCRRAALGVEHFNEGSQSS
jgi:hypothetical protein